jgi:hypothetical protein
VFVLNKCDLVTGWEIDDGARAALRGAAAAIVETSARTGAGVEEAFAALVAAMMAEERERPVRGAQ